MDKKLEDRKLEVEQELTDLIQFKIDELATKHNLKDNKSLDKLKNMLTDISINKVNNHGK